MASADGSRSCKFDPLPDGHIPTGDLVLGRIQGENGGYVVQAVNFVDGEAVLDPGHYLLFPNRHVPRVGDVYGWSSVKETLLHCIPEFVGLKPADRPDHAIYELHGPKMGRTIPDHAHEHVVIGDAAALAEKFAAVSRRV